MNLFNLIYKNNSKLNIFLYAVSKMEICRVNHLYWNDIYMKRGVLASSPYLILRKFSPNEFTPQRPTVHVYC